MIQRLKTFLHCFWLAVTMSKEEAGLQTWISQGSPRSPGTHSAFLILAGKMQRSPPAELRRSQELLTSGFFSIEVEIR